MDATAIADDLTIRRVLAEYCHVVDDGRFDELVELFTEDGEFRFGSLHAQGREGLKAWFEEFQPPEQRGKHLTSNSVITVDGDRATVTSDFVFFGFDDRRLVPVMTGQYLDVLTRAGATWRIHSRDAVLLRPPR